ncbi:hypothetical protein D3C78_1540470 [compost metagenome]
MPFKAAITGLGKRSMRFMVASTFCKNALVPPWPACDWTYFRSAPAQKARPEPVSTTERTSVRSCAASSAASMPCRTSGVSAFIASGRFRRIHMACSRTSAITTGDGICASLVAWRGCLDFAFRPDFRDMGLSITE